MVIRGECYDRQFMFGKGAGGFPTASSILSDVMARLHGYRYEYKKMHYLGRPVYTTDVTLRVYLRYSAAEAGLPAQLGFSRIREQYSSDSYHYVVGDISLARLIEHRAALRSPSVFLCNLPQFFLDRD